MVIIRVLLRLLPELDPVTFRAIHQGRISTELGLRQPQVSRAIHQLLKLGYIEEYGLRQRFGSAYMKQYRLKSSNPDVERFLVFTRSLTSDRPLVFAKQKREPVTSRLP